MINEIVEFVKLNGFEIVTAVSMIVAGASVLANFTKTDVDNKVLAFVGKAIALLAGNVRVNSLKK